MKTWAWIDEAGWVHAQPITNGEEPERPARLRRKLILVETEKQGDPRYETLDAATGKWAASAEEVERLARHEQRARLNAMTAADREAEREERWAARFEALEARVKLLEEEKPQRPTP